MHTFVLGTSSFLFWELKPENWDKWQVYEFLEKAQHGGMHNQLASTDGVTSLSLVLDGQQRLTALMVGLRGTYTAKKKYKRWDNPDAWSVQKLHLDLLADPRFDGKGSTSSNSLNRLNVATSRAQCAVLLVASPHLFVPDCSTPQQMKSANALCRFRELATVAPARKATSPGYV